MTSNPELGLVSLPVISLIPGPFFSSPLLHFEQERESLLTDMCALAHCNMASPLYHFTKTVYTEIINTARSLGLFEVLTDSSNVIHRPLLPSQKAYFLRLLLSYTCPVFLCPTV